jgi:hypothetical protein
MSNGEGFANLGAAVLSFLGSRHKARKEDRRESRRQDREDKRFREEMDLRRTQVDNQGRQIQGQQDFQREALDRTHPKKSWADKIFDAVSGMVKPASAQENLTNAQAGYWKNMGDAVGKTNFNARGTPPIFPGAPKMGGNGRANRAPKPGKVEPPTLMSQEGGLKNVADALVIGVRSKHQKLGRQFDPNGVNWDSVVDANDQIISEKLGRQLYDDEKAALKEIVRKRSMGFMKPVSGSNTR